MEVSAILLEHEVELLNLLGGPQLRLLLGLNGAVAGDGVGLAETEIRFRLGFFLGDHSCTSNSMVSIRLKSVVFWGVITSGLFDYGDSGSGSIDF